MHGNIDHARVVDEALNVSRSICPVDPQVLDLRRRNIGNLGAELHDSTKIIRFTWRLTNEIHVI